MALQIEKPTNRELSLERSKLASHACERGAFDEAALLYGEAISLDPCIPVLYTNRSAVYLKTKQYELALEDGQKAAELKPNWQKAHYRQAVALQCMGKYQESLAAFASALAHDQKSQQLLSGIIDTAMKSPLKENIEKIFARLQLVNMDQNPFVVVSIIGQELLNAGHIQPAITCLENALKIGTVGLRMRGSVISALTSAYWKVGNLSRSIELMQEDLEISRSSADHDGECRVLGNLGNAYFTMKQHEEALNAHRTQLLVASKHKNKKGAASALSSIAHVYVSLGDYPNAIDSHNKAIDFQRKLNDPLGEALELGHLGAAHLLAGNVNKSIECHTQQLTLAKTLKNDKEIALAYGNLGSAYNQKGNYQEAAKLHGQVLKIAETLGDPALEARACAGLGGAYRATGNLNKALKYYERQQAVAVKLKDRIMEGRALSNLGIIYLEQGECLHALKLHKVHLAICQEFGDRAGQGQAYGNMGCAYCALKKYEQAIKYHEKELAISKEVNDTISEACTHGNLAVAYQGLGKSDEARKHYEQHLAISRSNRDTYNEGVALFNLGNFYSSSGSFKKAIAFYEKYLSLTQSGGDKKGENKACHNLAFAHFSLGHLEESVRLYKQNIELAQSIGDKNTLARAYCNLGLVYKDLGDFQNSLMCQTNFQTVSHEIGYSVGECRALGNIGDIYVNTKRTREAVGCYERQVKIAEKLKDRGSLCQAYAALGHAYKVLGKVDKALVCHSKELAFRREFDDTQGLFKALDHIGTDCTASGRTDEAIEYFSEQRLIADRVKDPHLQARAYGNLGQAKLNAGSYSEAMRYFGNQIETLERVAASSVELGRAQGNLAECLYMLGNHEQARELYECYLTSAKETGTPNDQDKAYQGLGNTYRALGNLQQALFCFENRLVFAHELTETTAKGSAYGELGNLHRTMGNFEQAAACYGQQLTLAKECQDLESESDAECGLGEVYAKMGDYETALVHHENDLKLADKLHNSMRQSRAFGNLGLVYELMREHKKASECQEQHLSIAAQVSDRVAKVNAYSSLGRNHYLMANFAQAISYFKQGLTIAETLGRSEDEATIRYWLGVALCAKKDILPSLEQLYQAIELYEKLRDVGVSTGRFQLAMHEQQTLCYQVLQRVLIDLGRREEALVIAERARAHDFIDFLLCRPDAQRAQEKDWVRFESYDQIMDVVNKQNVYFLCYSLVLGYLCIWLIVPQHGIVKFHELRLADETPELVVNMDAGVSTTSESLLERLVGQIRENIGVEPACGSSVSTMSSSLSGSDLDEPPSPFDGSHSRCSSEAGSISSTPSNLSYIKNGFLKKGFRKLNGIRHDRNKNVTTALPVQVLYDTLIAPVEEFLPRSPQSDGSLHDLILVLQGDLYLVPFSLLHGHSKDYLHKRFSLLTVPSIRALLLSPTTPQRPHTTRLVVGDPQLPLSFDQYRCTPSTQGEAELVGTLFGSKPLIGNDASKDVVCRKVQEAECIHFATNTSWKHSALVLSPSKGNNRNSGGSDSFMPSPTEFLLTASEISHMKLSAKMIVLSCAQNETRNKMSLDGLLCLVRSFLLAGCSCVLVSLWPVPEPAYRLLLQGFYKRFLRGMRASRALAHAVKLVESNKEFDHPSNWAGFVLVGRDVKVPKKTIQLREALIVVIESTANCREALKVILHLVDKANQRLLNNNTSLMYTAEASIETKLGETQGWRDVLTAAGFRFRKAAKNLPDAVFFPLKDEKGKLRQCGDILRSLLGLSPTTLQAISKVLSAPTLVRALLDLFNLVLSSFAKGLNNVQVPLPLNLWHMIGCHELLASMAFDLLGVGKDEVMLRSGGVNSRRVLQCSVVALNTLTGGLGTDNIQFNGEFPLRRTGSDSSLKSSVSTISSFSYASAERTIQARSYNGSSRRSHVSDIESILDDLEKCQEESSVDPDVTDGYPNSSDDIPINSESRALSLDRKRNTRMNTSQVMNSPKLTQVNISQNIKSPNLSETDGLTNSSLFTNNNTLAPPEVTSLSPLSSSGRSAVSSPVRMNGYVNGLRENRAAMAKSPVIDRTSFPFPSHFRDTSDSLDSESSTSVSSPGHKTPGSINLMQHRTNGVGRNRGDKVGNVRNTGDQNGVDRSPQMRRGNLRRGFNAVEHEVDLSHDIDKSHDHTHDKSVLRHENHVNENHVTSRARSVSFDSIIDSDDTADPKDRRSDDVATFHALIQNTRGTRRTLYTRGNKSNVNKRFSKSEETLQYVGKDHEPRELFSMELDAESVISSDRPRDSDVTSGVSSSSSSYLGARLQNGSETNAQITHIRRKLKSDHLANLKNLQASSC